MAIEGKVPASGAISFNTTRGNLGENEPNYPCIVDPRIINIYQQYLMRDPEESGALYWQSLLESGQLDFNYIDNLIRNSPEAAAVAAAGAPVAPLGPTNNYNMNRDMFRVITKSNDRTTIPASTLRSKDNSYKQYTSPWLADSGAARVATLISPKLMLEDYFGGDQFTDADTLKVTTYAHWNENPIAWVHQSKDVVNFFINLGGTFYESPQVRNIIDKKYCMTQIYYDPTDRSLQVRGLWGYSGATSSNKWCWASIVRIEYIPHPIPANFWQYYPEGYQHFQANYD